MGAIWRLINHYKELRMMRPRKKMGTNVRFFSSSVVLMLTNPRPEAVFGTNIVPRWNCAKHTSFLDPFQSRKLSHVGTQSQNR
ncbi:hypothetical protein Pla52n_33230 [Stieleria varia]|uniref:Uncharacterized protein n=1 Tax=Stieleria varia TaxID=2528005 RepID=A0A5C6AQE6_9BACT|nr:hypothetical protein Pla52n_33230 [Stieleria varia]